MITCNECGTLYDPSGVVVPNPVPNLMCSKCSTVFTREQADDLPCPYNPNAPHSEEGT